MSLRKINNVDINIEDFKMHSKSIEKINNSIWKKLEN